MLKSIALIIVLAVAALLLYATTRPDTFAVQRSTVIQAGIDTLFPLINDLRQFNTWNPYARKDPAMQISYRGPASGPGMIGRDFEAGLAQLKAVAETR